MTALHHEDRAHALLSASGAYRWLACTPSAVLESRESDTSSPYAAEGTLAHEFAQAYLQAEPWMEGTLEQLRKERLYAREMEEFAWDYAAYVRSQMGPDDQLDVEVRLDFSSYVPDGFGTGDCVIARDGLLTIVDFKYGKGVRVASENNPQMMLYALGAIEAYDFAFEFDKVKMCIFQPRIDNVSEFEMSRRDLEDWASLTLAPKARLAAKGEGEFCPGDHCQFCRYAKKCKALAEYSLAVASKDFEDESGQLDVNELLPEDWQMILSRVPLVKKWLDLVDAEALNRLMSDPESIPGFKVVEGRSVRKYGDTAACADLLVRAGYAPTEFNKPAELKGITEMTRLLGRKKFDEILGPQIVKPQGKPTVAPLSDKRPAFVPTDPEEEFENEENKESA